MPVPWVVKKTPVPSPDCVIANLVRERMAACELIEGIRDDVLHFWGDDLFRVSVQAVDRGLASWWPRRLSDLDVSGYLAERDG